MLSISERFTKEDDIQTLGKDAVRALVKLDLQQYERDFVLKLARAKKRNKSKRNGKVERTSEEFSPYPAKPADPSTTWDFTFIDLFAGIGGFHIAMHSLGGKCVFASEIDRFARITYELNYRKWSPELFDLGYFNRDIEQADVDRIPDFDVLCAGFPCQPFSQAGLKKGFDDLRGTLFFNIAKIVEHKVEAGKPPTVLLLENVKGLRGHDKGNTLRVILQVLDQLGYTTHHEVLNSKYFGLPQNRERLFIVASLKSAGKCFKFPLGLDRHGRPIFERGNLNASAKPTKVGTILIDDVPANYTISDELYDGHLRRLRQHREKGNGFGFSLFTHESPYTSTISARYYKDGSEIMIDQGEKNPRKLHPKEAAKLQGFPIDEDFQIYVSDTQAYKQFGNSVSVPVIRTLANEIKVQILGK